VCRRRPGINRAREVPHASRGGYSHATLDRLGQEALTQNGVTVQVQAFYY